MLAVQRPSMGSSSKPPDHEMPFGYSFDAPSFPYPSPTAPAPGASLLDDNETKFLDNFFGELGNDQFNFDMFTNPPDGSELGFGWDELPPTFMGTTSSFGQHPVIGNHGLPSQTFGDLNLQTHPGPSIPPSTSADVLAAATLLQNGRSQSIADSASFRGPTMRAPPNGSMRSHSTSQLPQSRPTHGLPQRATGETFYHHDYYTDMVFGGDAELAQRRRIAAQKVEIQWGSDIGFASPQGFKNTEQDKIAASERSHLDVVDSAFRIDNTHHDSSADNTRPSSPAHQRTKSLNQTSTEDHDSRPKKRRKSNFPEEDGTEPKLSASTTAKQAGKKRKPARKTSNDVAGAESSEAGHRRRKSAAATAAATKAARENLTEDQKRENHIKSEQKRRTLIREGFEDLGELVPGLRSGGFSKSAVLIMAADWLEELLKSNAELRDKLEELEEGEDDEGP